jgi:O-antigen/teichoic acid export membrane protein
MAIGAIPLATLTIVAQFFRGLKWSKASQLTEAGLAPTLAFLGFLLVGRRFGLLGAIASYHSAVVATAALGLFAWHRSTPQLRDVAPDPAAAKDLLRSARPLFAINILDIAAYSLPFFLLGAWAPNEDLGIIAIAGKISVVIRFIQLAVDTILLPKLAELYEARDREGFVSTARLSTWMVIGLSSPLVALCVFAPTWTMGLFGKDFRQGALVLSLLAMGQFLSLASGPSGQTLMMTGYETLLRNLLLPLSILNICLNLWLIPKYGLLGATLAITSYMTLQGCIGTYLVSRHLGIQICPLLPTSLTTPPPPGVWSQQEASHE